MGIGQNRCCIAPPSIALASIDLLGHLNTANSFRPYFNAKISALTGMEHMMAALNRIIYEIKDDMLMGFSNDRFLFGEIIAYNYLIKY